MILETVYQQEGLISECSTEINNNISVYNTQHFGLLQSIETLLVHLSEGNLH